MSASSPESFTPKLITAWREGYSLAHLRADALAGLTVAIIALPLAMALAIASGASPDKGLVTAIVAGFLISALGGSRVQVGGPTGAFVVVIAGVIAQHGYSGLILATAIAGILLVIAGYAKLGQLMKYVPMPVVTGFTAGIAVIIATSQIGDFLGLDAGEVPAEFLGKWKAYILALDTLSVAALAVGALASSAQAVRPGGGFLGPCGPRYCLDVWDPVICPNGQIYSNHCYAARACQTGCVPATY